MLLLFEHALAMARAFQDMKALQHLALFAVRELYHTVIIAFPLSNPSILSYHSVEHWIDCSPHNYRLMCIPSPRFSCRSIQLIVNLSF
jgi:hypothetical protein